MDNEHLIVIVSDKTHYKGKYIKKFQRSFVHDEKNDIIYIPATMQDLLLAGWDVDQKWISNQLGEYLPLSWFIREYPTGDFQEIEKKLISELKRQ